MSVTIMLDRRPSIGPEKHQSTIRTPTQRQVDPLLLDMQLQLSIRSRGSIDETLTRMTMSDEIGNRRTDDIAPLINSKIGKLPLEALASPQGRLLWRKTIMPLTVSQFGMPKKWDDRGPTNTVLSTTLRTALMLACRTRVYHQNLACLSLAFPAIATLPRLMKSVHVNVIETGGREPRMSVSIYLPVLLLPLPVL